ncbi:unknown protein [Seminavis robusta]|uniref:Uncharacterized protein n=1 Tax=Seminavis robusta TaxID=568900 RepID=A0A9N8HZH1_9STRA|nr:unknown protein [Seminavis robusta]|eukprot:Sro2276_g321671.1  (183) ;mRNA; f:14368-14916
MTVDSTNLFSTENLENASDIAKSNMLELRASVKTRDWSLRLLALLGGVALIFTAALEFVSNILNLNALGALIEFNVIFLGIIVLVLEGSQISLPPKFQHTLHKLVCPVSQVHLGPRTAVLCCRLFTGDWHAMDGLPGTLLVDSRAWWGFCLCVGGSTTKSQSTLGIQLSKIKDRSTHVNLEI